MHLELLTAEQIYDADRMTIFGGMAGVDLMQHAGEQVVAAVEERYAPCPVLILCGSGNNGGDGYIVARLLKQKGWDVTVVSMLPESVMQGDAAVSLQAWKDAGGELTPWDAQLLRDTGLVVDAVLGVGLARPVSGELALNLKTAAKWCADHNVPVVAVDIPSGVHTDSGHVLGVALPAVLTVTFFRAKQGLYLSPGKFYCGEIVTADIGISETVLETIGPRTLLNLPAVWTGSVPPAAYAELPRAATEAPLPPASHAMALLREGKPCVITPRMLKQERGLGKHTLHGEVILLTEESTHDMNESDTLIDRARALARKLGAVTIVGGGDTVIAAPDGRVAITDDRFPTSTNATEAETVPAMLYYLLSHHMPAFDAACMAVWLHDMAIKRCLDAGSDLVISDAIAGALKAVNKT